MVICPAGPDRRMSTGTEQGGIRMTFQGLTGANRTLTLLDEGSYTLFGAVGILILGSSAPASLGAGDGETQAAI